MCMRIIWCLCTIWCNAHLVASGSGAAGAEPTRAHPGRRVERRPPSTACWPESLRHRPAIVPQLPPAAAQRCPVTSKRGGSRLDTLASLVALQATARGCMSRSLSVCPSVSVPGDPSVCLVLCLFVCVAAPPPVRPTLLASVYPPVWLFACLSVHVAVCLCPLV